MKKFFDALLIVIKENLEMDAFEPWVGNAMISYAFVAFSLPGIKQKADYYPAAEIEMLFYNIRALNRDSILFPLLVDLLIELIEDLNFKDETLAQNYLEKISDVLKSLPANVFALVDINHPGPVLDYLISTGLVAEKATSSPTANVQEKIARLINRIILVESLNLNDHWNSQLIKITKNHISELCERCLSKPEKIDADAARELFNISFTQRHIFCFEKALIDIVQALFEASNDKKCFIETVLNILKIMYSEFGKYNLLNNLYLLDTIRFLLPIFAKAIPKETLIPIMNNFLLPPPAGPCCWQDCYNEVQIVSCLIRGEVVPDHLITKDLVRMRALKNEYLWESMKVFARHSVPTDVFFSRVPGITPILLEDIEKASLTDQFEEFVAHATEVNRHAGLFQQRSLPLFFLLYEKTVRQFISIGKNSAILWMRQLVASSVLPLEKRLESTPITDPLILAELDKRFSDKFAKSKTIEELYLCFLMIDNIKKIQGSDLNADAVIKSFIGKSRWVGELLKNLFTFCIKHVLQEAVSIADIEKLLEERISQEQLPYLIYASNHMQGKENRNIYLEFLKMDLLGGDHDRFLHDESQISLLGKGLARHNQKIQHTLSVHGIDPYQAIHYVKQYHFTVLPEDMEVSEYCDDENLYLLLETSLNELHKIISLILADDKYPVAIRITSQLNKIISTINELQLFLERKAKDCPTLKKGKIIEDLLVKKETQLQKIQKNLRALLLLKSPSVLPDSCRDILAQIQSIIAKRKNLSRAHEVYHFTVKQWQKTNPDTFFLGNEVGCCLATNGMYFKTMVERRMDDACFFHVAIDRETSKPVALIWLYLATTVDDRIVLIANFFEVKTNYGLDKYMRKALLNGLLSFTAEYLRDNPGISGFYMGKLTYGLNQGDLDAYGMVTLHLVDKIGGPYAPGAAIGIDPERTADQYYLDSLKKSEFHKFDPLVLTESMKDEGIEHTSAFACGASFFSSVPPDAMGDCTLAITDRADISPMI